MRSQALVVGDNRRNINWGGRGAGLALCQLLNETLEVASTIEGREFLLDAVDYGFVGTLIPARYDHLFLHLYRNRARHRVFDLWVRLEEAWGARDFVSADPGKTADNIVKFRLAVPQLEELHAKVRRADVVVINGEGDFVFTTPPRREVLFMLGIMELARRLGKPTFFVNAMLSDCPRTGCNETTVGHARALFKACAGVFLRDPASIEYARRQMPDVPCRLIPDALFSWRLDAQRVTTALPPDGDLIVPYPERMEWLGRLDFSQPYICIGGSAAAGANRAAAVERYSELVERVKALGLGIVLTENDGPDEFLEDVARRTGAGFVGVTTPIYAAFAILACARLFISGRYHPTILASMGGTPSIFLGSTAHKMASLQALLGYSEPRTFAACPSTHEIADILDLARSYLRAGEDMRRRIAAAAARRGRETGALPLLILESLTPPAVESTGTVGGADRPASTVQSGRTRPDHGSVSRAR